ncbi:hypothetical protein CYMTET_37494 [Cymbomonas tetramitiformis]|uniref:Uncharacterized protein n=1 Tax=Cymbomonas tetramitiformis TaxID=36881 RepID=A0AAE0F666_9CHLO|nr:hypothetical protein CYMTET_37494 [Cymbomonas tetramitiformis]
MVPIGWRGLQGFTLAVEEGATVALVGKSGSGKSTAVQLLERFYDPLSGRVLLDGIDLRELDVTWLRRQIGLVGQEPVLFAGSIAQNIAHGLYAADGSSAVQAQVERAARMANAHSFISELAEGYDTEVGQGGSQLSGGQKQRLAIARAMVKDPSLLLLDEATSALDNESERVVQAALDVLLAEHPRTTVVVAHRLTTIRNATKIVVVADGCVAEQGTHEELMQAGCEGRYVALVRAARASSSSATLAGCTDEADEEGPRSWTQDAEDARSSQQSNSPSAATPKMVYRAQGELSERLLGNATREEEEEEEAEAATRKLSPQRRVWGLQERRDLPFTCMGVIGAALAGSVNPAMGIVFTKSISLFYLDDPHLMQIRSYCWGSVIAAGAFFQVLGETLRFAGFGVSGERVTKKLRAQLFSSVLRQEVGWFDLPEQAVGRLSAIMAEEVATVQALSGQQLGQNIMFLFTLSTGLTLSFCYGSWKLTLVALGVIPILTSGIAIELALAAGSKSSGGDGVGKKASELLGAAITSVRTVTAFCLQDRFQTAFEDALEAHLRWAKPRSILYAFFTGYAQLALFASLALMYWYGGYLRDKGEIDFNQMLLPILSIFMMAAGLGQAAASAADIGRATKAAEDVFAIIDRAPEIDYSAEEGLRPARVDGALLFQDVRFAYPARPAQPVLRSFSLVVEAGTTLGLVGASGSGKSTTVQLIERFYDPASGRVLLDGVDLRELNLQWLRRQIGLVSQEPVLFGGSIAMNISLGKEDASRSEIEQAARMANAHSFITSFPQGYDTDVGSSGNQLSGGQKQRTAIARAIIKKPSIFLLDEATSALDNESERVVQEALDQMLKEYRCTTLVIAHRLTTIQDSDHIAVVEFGRVVEQGTHDQLMASGPDSKYVALQATMHTS